jgi:hypothetical protein
MLREARARQRARVRRLQGELQEARASLAAAERAYEEELAWADVPIALGPLPARRLTKRPAAPPPPVIPAPAHVVPKVIASAPVASGAAHVVTKTAPRAPRPVPVAPRNPPVPAGVVLPVLTTKEKKEAAMRRGQLQRRARGRPKLSIEELRAVVAASDVPVTKLKPGAHAGWTPTWLG